MSKSALTAGCQFARVNIWTRLKECITASGRHFEYSNSKCVSFCSRTLNTWLIVKALLIKLKLSDPRLKQHNFVSVVDIKTKLSTVAYT